MSSSSPLSPSPSSSPPSKDLVWEGEASSAERGDLHQAYAQANERAERSWAVTGAVTASAFLGRVRAATAAEALEKARTRARAIDLEAIDPEVTTITVESEDGERATDQEGPPARRTLEELTANPPEGWQAHPGTEEHAGRQDPVRFTRFMCPGLSIKAYPRHARPSVGNPFLSPKDLAAAHREIAKFLDHYQPQE